MDHRSYFSALERLKASFGPGGEELLPGIIEVFFEQAPKVLAEAHRALDGSHLAELGRAAHTLKGQGAQFGAARLEKACLDIEKLAKEGIVEGVPELIREAEEAFRNAVPALRAACRQVIRAREEQECSADRRM
jgi:HPt (histidine-containing phosphotransfer) domain-containing protein